MRYDPTPALELALRRADALARRAGAPVLAPRDLLRGLLAEKEGTPWVYLQRAGIADSYLKDKPTAEPTPEETPQLPLDPASRTALNQARELAMLHSEEGSISTDQLLLALLQHDEALRGELEAAGLDFAQLHRQIAVEAPALQVSDTILLDDEDDAPEVARILDASANRAREALRVLEDLARFVLEDALLSGRLKQLRHDLAAAMEAVPRAVLLAARDTLGDVGTTLTTPREGHRPDLGAVVQANARRLQEALRSLEEFGKVVSPELGRAVEQMRYESYTLERALVVVGQARARLADVQLYVLVTDALCRASLTGTVKEAILGGAQVIQLREKGVEDRTLLARARDVRQITRSAGVLFIVNDRPDIARLVGADGVHLGQDDLPLREARRLLGPQALIGVSTHDVAQVRRAVLGGASYLGVGPTFASPTKGFETLAGLDFVRQAAAETALPMFVLGGINRDNVDAALAAGARRIAVSSAICAAPDPRAAASALRQKLTTETRRAQREEAPSEDEES